MIENYKSELRRQKADKDIATIPVEFPNRANELYAATEGTVTVIDGSTTGPSAEEALNLLPGFPRRIWRVVDTRSTTSDRVGGPTRMKALVIAIGTRRRGHRPFTSSPPAST
jgi:hypothetical protein